MRLAHAAALADDSADRLLTTGEAARLLGVSRQHVVDLCEAGDLPHSLVGKHRRILSSDVEELRTSRSRMSKQDARSLLLAYAVAGEIVRNPDSSIAKAKRNLEAMKSTRHKGGTRVWLDEWDQLLNGSTLALLQALTATNQRSRELRQNSPFAGVITEATRQSVLALAASSKART